MYWSLTDALYGGSIERSAKDVRELRHNECHYYDKNNDENRDEEKVRTGRARS